MSDRLETARSIRIGAERLRQIARHETNSVLASEMRRIADEMDENAAHLERAYANDPPKPKS